MSNPDFICNTCIGKYEDRPQLLEKRKRTKGCEQHYAVPIHTIIQDNKVMRFTNCIGNYVSMSAVTFIEATRGFENGVMPFAGGYMEQPNKIMEIFRIIQAQTLVEKDRKAQQRNNKMKSVATRAR